MPELVIHSGTVLDGTGAAPYEADILVRDGKIEGIGSMAPIGPLDIDASGLNVAPGFIDIHSHSDFTLLVDPRAVSAIHQGVTLEVIGNCGFGCFPIADRQLAAGNIYGLSGAVPITWTSAAGYLERLETARPAVNVLTLVPNGQLRLATVGMRGRPADSRQRNSMIRLLEEALEAGAWGLSTGLEYPAEASVSEEEIVALCRVVARAGGLYATHTRNRDGGAAAAVEEAIRVAAAADVRLQVSHLLPRSGPRQCALCLDHVEQARREGVDIAFDMHTRLFGMTYLATVIPPWARTGGETEFVARLRDPESRARMKAFHSVLSGGGDWGRVMLLDNAIYPELAERDFASIAAARNQEPLDAIYDLLADAGAERQSLMAIIRCYSEDQQRQVFGHDLCVPASDATTLAPDGALASSVFHGAYTWASWFYRFMVEETGTLTPAEAVYRLTGKPAAILGLADRGRLAPGVPADIAIFDPTRFRDRGTTLEPNRLAAGMVHVLVNGVPTLRDGTLTGARTGMVLRRGS